jgi:hypothetical protein
LALPLLATCAVLVACEKSNDVVVQEQLQDAANTCPKGCDQPKPRCSIKGNISGTGMKWYFMPKDEQYQFAIIEPAKGEHWFCTPAEAEANGFRPVPKN